jgi:2-polyprenyl-3-methyl-5-hydroxy-6-metoxy-1,4-benzoquinol methylase
MKNTSSGDYTERLLKLSSKKWKLLFRVQEPYRRKILSYETGKTLDIGCGVGRLLINLPEGSVGLDHNRKSVEHCRNLGLNAFTVDEFLLQRENLENYDTILLAHLLEHLNPEEQRKIISDYLKYLRPKGKVIVITPQEAGYKSDETHVTFTNIEAVKDILVEFQVKVIKFSSFPLPRFFGRSFKYNEFHVVGVKG